MPPDPGEITDTVVGEYQSEARVARGDVEGVPSQRRDPPPGVRDHRQPALVRQGEDRLEALVVEPELLRARVELDAPGAARPRALRPPQPGGPPVAPART